MAHLIYWWTNASLPFNLQETEDNKEAINHIDREIDMYMQEFSQYLLRRSNEKTRSNTKTRQNILNIVKTCYYATHCPQDVLDSHISRVIFDPVIWNKGSTVWSYVYRENSLNNNNREDLPAQSLGGAHRGRVACVYS